MPMGAGAGDVKDLFPPDQGASLSTRRRASTLAGGQWERLAKVRFRTLRPSRQPSHRRMASGEFRFGTVSIYRGAYKNARTYYPPTNQAVESKTSKKWGGFRLIEHLARGFTANTERLEERGLRRAFPRLNPHLPEDIWEEVLRQLLQTDAPSLVNENRRLHRYSSSISAKDAKGGGDTEVD